MSRVARTLLFALVAFWLPTTLHCRLEAAGIFNAAETCLDEHGSETGSADCKSDVCPTVEDTLFKESAKTLKVSAPDVTLVPLFTIFVCAPIEVESISPKLSPERIKPPLELAVGWQFLTRAVLPARAPDALNA